VIIARSASESRFSNCSGVVKDKDGDNDGTKNDSRTTLLESGKGNPNPSWANAESASERRSTAAEASRNPVRPAGGAPFFGRLFKGASPGVCRKIEPGNGKINHECYGHTIGSIEMSPELASWRLVPAYMLTLVDDRFVAQNTGSELFPGLCYSWVDNPHQAAYI